MKSSPLQRLERSYFDMQEPPATMEEDSVIAGNHYNG